MGRRIFGTLIFFLIAISLALPASAEITEIETFSATILEVTRVETKTLSDDSVIVQQDLKFVATSGPLKGQEFISYGISDVAVVQSRTYQAGDKVFITQTPDADGQPVFYVTDHDRRSTLYWLAGVFALVVLAIGRWSGFRALVGLVVTFGIIMLFVIPRILDGWNPVLVAVIGSICIMAAVVYIAEGWHRRAHLAIGSIIAALFATAGLSILVSAMAQLSGLAEESAFSLLSYTDTRIDFRGLLLAGFMIGTLGVLDDVVISQIEAVEQIRLANPALSRRRIFTSAFTIGRAHLSAVVNTLFLAYAGASLPLLLLFNLRQPPFLEASQVINHELVATEIVRTLVGSIGLALAIPIATFVAVLFLVPQKKPTEVSEV